MKNKGNAVFKTLGVLVASAFLAAISIVCGKYLAVPGGEVMRFSFENMPIIMAGMAFGPLVGAIVGAVADIIGCILVGYTINPLVTLGACTVGLVGGLTYFLLGRVAGCPYIVRISASVALAHVTGSVIIKTIGLAAYYAIPFHVLLLWRILNYLIVGAIEGVILYHLMKNRMIIGQINSILRKK